MSNPFWFNIIQQWRQMGKGEYGVTFPFLVGAVARNTNSDPDKRFIKNLFEEMKNNPVAGHYCEVRWCGDVKEPVVSISPIEKAPTVSLQAEHKIKEIISVGFTSNLMDIFHLDCKTFEECLVELISRTHKLVEAGKFSKNNGKFAAFTKSDIEFIETVQKIKNT